MATFKATIEEIKRHDARSILLRFGFTQEMLDTKGMPCPKCADGGIDRFYARDASQGKFGCRKCCERETGDVVGAVAWMLGTTQGKAAEEIAAYLHLDKPTPKPAVEFRYVDEEGNHLFTIHKKPIDQPPWKKTLCQRASGEWNIEGVRRVLYNLPEVLKADFVFVVEGEACVEALRAVGLVGTCNPFGAGSWKPEFAKVLEGKRVVVIPDNDEEGRKHADKVLATLSNARKLTLPGAEKSDVDDWLKAGGTREELTRLAEDALKAQPERKRSLEIIPGRKLSDDHPRMKEPLIDGLLRFGEIMNIIAPSKFGKTWLVLGLVVCVAMGLEWLGLFRTTPCRVLLIDNELHKETLADRLRRVCKAMGLDEIPDNIDILPVRGENWNIHELANEIGETFKDRYGMIVMDALYRFLPEKTNEGANGDMIPIYNRLDSIAMLNGCAIVLIHHSSKGDQSGKDMTDVGSGAGVITRATDSHLVLRRHELDECAVLELAPRSWPKLNPQTIQFEFPNWAVKCITPALKQAKTGRDVKQQNLDAETDGKIIKMLEGSKGLTKPQIRGKTGYGDQRVSRALVRLQEVGKLQTKRVKNAQGKRKELWICTTECLAVCTDNLSNNTDGF